MNTLAFILQYEVKKTNTLYFILYSVLQGKQPVRHPQGQEGLHGRRGEVGHLRLRNLP